MTPRAILLALLSALLLVPSSSAEAEASPWTWPLGHHSVDRPFDPPQSRYGAGHRGVDLPGSSGDPVRAVAAGTVTFAGRVAGVPVITVSHGRERSTYQPVAARVEVGDAVLAGDGIGVLEGAGSHCTGTCLHLGRIADDDTYLDPLTLLAAAGRFRLIDPSGPPPPPPAGPSSLRRPVGGSITSPYGMRVHPVTGVRKLHDGTDFGAACGAPVHAAAGGTVTEVGSSGAYGRRVVVEHGSGLETSYSHLSSYATRAGERVAVGDPLGLVGSTGMSTGCHLHFMVRRDGRTVDPMTLL